MRIFELQNDIKEQLEADVHLMETCAVVCADALDAVNEIERALAKAGDPRLWTSFKTFAPASKKRGTSRNVRPSDGGGETPSV